MGRALPSPALGRVVRALREDRGLGQDALARRAGVTQTTVSFVERAVVRPQRGTVEKLGHALGVSMGEIASRVVKRGSRCGRLVARGLVKFAIAAVLAVTCGAALGTVHGAAQDLLCVSGWSSLGDVGSLPRPPDEGRHHRSNGVVGGPAVAERARSPLRRAVRPPVDRLLPHAGAR